MKTKSTQTKSFLSLTCALVLLCLGGQANAALTIINGDFQDLTGLTVTTTGWYRGVPAGWTGYTGNLGYNVINWNSGNLGANIQTLGPSAPFAPLYQSAGLLDSAGKVTLTFNILGLSPNYGIAAGIYSAKSDGSPITAFNSLASGSYTQASGSLQTLEVLNVAAGTRVGVAFWSWGAGGVGVDNVSLVPEPSTSTLLLLGFAGVAALRRRRC